MLRVSIVAWACCAGSVLAQSFFVPANLLPFANDRLQSRNGAFPSGNPVFAGVPYRIEPSGNNIWFAENASGANPRVLEVPINITEVKKVHTLISSAWGQPGPSVLAQVQFVGANGTIVPQDLVGNFNIRDWNQNIYTNAISSPNTQVVFSANNGNTRIDMQTWTLPSAFETEELRRVRFIDNGAANQQRLYVQGLTMELSSPPTRRWTTGLNANNHFYTAIQTPQGVTWEQANQMAQAMEGYLATITSPEENAFVYSLIGGNQAYWRPGFGSDGWGPWIGGLQQLNAQEPGGGWGWLSGESFSFVNWSPGEPNNNYNGQNEDRMHYFGGGIPANNRWNDLPGTELLRGFIVESTGIFCNDIDINNDGASFDPQDIEAFLSIFSEGPCVPGSAECDGIDFNNDGGLFDPCDISSFLTVFSEGPCTLCGV